jgi:hypothetical protein
MVLPMIIVAVPTILAASPTIVLRFLKIGTR